MHRPRNLVLWALSAVLRIIFSNRCDESKRCTERCKGGSIHSNTRTMCGWRQLCEFELKFAWALVRPCLVPIMRKYRPMFFLTYLTLGIVLAVFNHDFCLVLESAGMSGLLGVCKPLLYLRVIQNFIVMYFPEESSHSFHKIHAGTYMTVRRSCVSQLICSFFQKIVHSSHHQRCIQPNASTHILVVFCSDHYQSQMFVSHCF